MFPATYFMNKLISFFHSLAEVHQVYESISGLKDKLVDISRESAKHQQVISIWFVMVTNFKLDQLKLAYNKK